MTRRPSYTDHPRTILWLIPGGSVELELAGIVETVEVEPFYLSKWPITNEQFSAFDPDHRPAEISPGPRDIAVGIDWTRAEAYCAWYRSLSRKPMRLPSEAEWLHACRGGAESDEAGPQASESELHGIGGLDPRIARDFDRINGFGLHGMTGGVWEWTADSEESAEGRRVLRGGSFRTQVEALGCNLRRVLDRQHRADDVGFRVAKCLR